MLADFEALGVTVDPAIKAEEESAFPVWDVNWPSFLLFLRCETQWRVVATMAGMEWLGIDYVAARAVFEASAKRGRRRSARRLFDDLRFMERWALPILNEARA